MDGASSNAHAASFQPGGSLDQSNLGICFLQDMQQFFHESVLRLSNGNRALHWPPMKRASSRSCASLPILGVLVGETGLYARGDADFKDMSGGPGSGWCTCRT